MIYSSSKSFSGPFLKQRNPKALGWKWKWSHKSWILCVLVVVGVRGQFCPSFDGGGETDYIVLRFLSGSLFLHQQPESGTLTLVYSAVGRALSRVQNQFLHRKKNCPFQSHGPQNSSVSRISNMSSQRSKTLKLLVRLRYWWWSQMAERSRIGPMAVGQGIQGTVQEVESWGEATCKAMPIIHEGTAWQGYRES